MVYAVLACIVAAACVGVVHARARRLAKVELPSSEELVSRVLAQAGDSTGADQDAVRRIVLDELVAEIDGRTRHGAEWARGLARVSLASGTALSLLGLSARPAGREWLAVAVAFLAGAAGMAGTAIVGRRADARARHVREHWSEVVRRARSRLQTP